MLSTHLICRDVLTYLIFQDVSMYISTLAFRLCSQLVSCARTFDSSRSHPSSSPYHESFGQACAHISLLRPQELPRESLHAAQILHAASVCMWHELYDSTRGADCTGLQAVRAYTHMFMVRQEPHPCSALHSIYSLSSSSLHFSRMIDGHVLCLS